MEYVPSCQPGVYKGMRASIPQSCDTPLINVQQSKFCLAVVCTINIIRSDTVKM